MPQWEPLRTPGLGPPRTKQQFWEPDPRECPGPRGRLALLGPSSRVGRSACPLRTPFRRWCPRWTHLPPCSRDQPHSLGTTLGGGVQGAPGRGLGGDPCSCAPPTSGLASRARGTPSTCPPHPRGGRGRRGAGREGLNPGGAGRAAWSQRRGRARAERGAQVGLGKLKHLRGARPGAAEAGVGARVRARGAGLRPRLSSHRDGLSSEQGAAAGSPPSQPWQ